MMIGSNGESEFLVGNVLNFDVVLVACVFETKVVLAATH
jgi:hypothetical protein